ncbi:hypothetical protein TgHK011_006149 [Trichoderma gracile]|nr:hypothetical protein TgHK011_006149 [Trichoderma gracile]
MRETERSKLAASASAAVAGAHIYEQMSSDADSLGRSSGELRRRLGRAQRGQTNRDSGIALLLVQRIRAHYYVLRTSKQRVAPNSGSTEAEADNTTTVDRQASISNDNTKSPGAQTSPDRAPIHPPEGINASAAQTQIHPIAAASLFASKVTFSSGGSPMFPLARDAAQQNPGLTWQADR